MNHENLRKTQNDRSAMEDSADTEYGQFKTRSVEHVEYCSCCGEELTQIEVLGSYLDQHIEGALEVCGALDVEYDSAHRIGVLGKIADSLVRTATLTEAVRLVPEGE
jgi:hypothetical protein